MTINQKKIDGITFEQPINGYAPAEDSWLLAKTITHVAGKKCLDMGCGSGIQASVFLTQGASEIICADINPHALVTSKKMMNGYFSLGKKQNTPIRYVETDLFSNLGNERFDIIAFNPPYVPSEEIKWREVDGGKEGREIIDRFLKEMPSHLSTGGTCYVLQSSLNRNEKTQKWAKENGFTSEIISREKLAFEELVVFQLKRLIK